MWIILSSCLLLSNDYKQGSFRNHRGWLEEADISKMLMGSDEFKSLICMIFYVVLMSQCSQGQNLSAHHVSLDSSIHNYALMNMGNAHSGILYDVPLPANYSGIKASFVRIRSATIWSRGANFSNVYMPPKTLPWPFSRRINIVYQNLGNLSSYYYNVPNYTLVAPIIGFLAYDAANDSRQDYGMIELYPMKEPILVNFPNTSWPGDANKTVQCVRFRINGKVEFANVTGGNSCTAHGHGHFSIVIPSQPEKRKQRVWKWWEIGFGVGCGGLVLLVGLGLVFYKWFRMRRVRKMEKESDRSEALESIWIGPSRMPSASGIRTTPYIEHNYVP